ncbi:23S rRNA (uracil(1939)-C(5))-methyltransferase RlmD [uncultured Oscillibacter sp.]|uniref:23S rRNA (uracil(1939)-C(5))-methyltransferase RlmD n=1 Tax=uncultured Oscillibacter sp. TaxID=876091 RepID=UPI0028046299|nr:23S rRNA (uracil(1939)-C(5))-methyltransferase RlmD [uncultured Oscillibacter sp.]
MDQLHENQIYTGTVESYSSEGLGIVRLDGAVVFVPGAVRGETIDLRITKVMKTAAAGEIVKIHNPSPDRAAPECPWYGQCGGCDFQHLTYPEELRAKRQRVQDALTRLGGADVQVEEILGAKNPHHYRNKSQYPVGADGAIGFYRARSHRVVPVKRCLIQPEAADKTAAAVGEWMRRYKIPAYDETTGKGLVRHIYVRVNQKGESLCCVVINGKQAPREPELAAYVCAAVPHTVGVLVNSNTKRGNVILGEKYRTLWGQDFLMDTLCGLAFKLSVPSFYQVNHDQAEVLYGRALAYAGLTGAETVVDLYCGIGTITLCLARQAGRVIGAEIVPAAIRDARENAARNHIENAEFFCGDAAEAAARLEAEGLRPDVITVDPPRKGLAPEVIGSIAAMGPSRVVYVSCDPATLGRDVKRFGELGYRAVRACAVDMFPGTRHVETVVLLSQQKPDDTIEIDLDLDELDATAAETKATYEEIKAYVWDKHHLKVSSLYISQIKRKCGLEVGQNYNLSKSENPKVPKCPPEKEAAIMDALRHFQMI